jgi:hypothetical protein
MKHLCRGRTLAGRRLEVVGFVGSQAMGGVHVAG